MGGNVRAGQTPGQATDAELLAAVRAGDAAALEALLTRYQPQLFRFGLRMCGNADDAGDVTQESLISMARSLRDFRGDASFSSWLYAIARSFCIKKRRRSTFAPAREESLDAPATAARRLADPAATPEQTAANQELGAALASAIDALDPPLREVLVLRDVEGLTAPEVAAVLGISVEAVKSRLHRARVAMRQALAPVWRNSTSEPPKGPACPDVLSAFSQHLEGELDPGICAAMERHLAGCGHCRGACESLKRTLAICRQLPTPDVPPSLAASIRTAVAGVLNPR